MGSSSRNAAASPRAASVQPMTLSGRRLPPKATRMSAFHSSAAALMRAGGPTTVTLSEYAKKVQSV